MNTAARTELTEALAGRTEQFGMRVAMMLGVGMALAPIIGWPVVPAVAGFVALQWLERQFVHRLRARGHLSLRVLWFIPLISTSNAIFGGLAFAAVLTGKLWAMLSGVLIMAGVLMNAGPTARTSMVGYIAAACPIGVYAGGLPIIAWRSGVGGEELWTLSLCILLLFAASLSMRGFVVRAIRAERQANRAKSAFLATISHEIRTPLNGVLGMAQAMAGDELPERQRARLDVITQSGETLLAILNDVLDLSKIEAGKVELEQAEFQLTSLVTAVHAQFNSIASQRPITFTLRIDEAAQGLYRGDADRLRQILSNLFSNALKFTDTGEISVEVCRSAETLEFVVRDTGIGIPADALKRLSNKFEQVDASTTRRYGGTGLGLAICRDLVELMGGAIDVRSVEGQGSDFRVKLPLGRLGEECELVTVSHTPERLFEAAGPLRVLAADDNEANRLVMAALLGHAGVDVTLVGNGAEALAHWRRQDWDVVLMDIQMPVMDGVACMRAIRAEEAAGRRSRTPIIALTANVMAHQIAEYALAGADANVAKPINVADLLNAIAAATNAPSPQPTEAAA